MGLSLSFALPRKDHALRFIHNVDIRGEDECWEWKAKRDKKNYGHMRVNKKDMFPHRFIFEQLFGSFPEVVMHKCDNPPCCNPRHLMAGTTKKNVLDRIQKGRSRYRNGIMGELKLTGKEKEEMVQLRSAGWTILELAAKFKVGYGTIRRRLG